MILWSKLRQSYAHKFPVIKFTRSGENKQIDHLTAHCHQIKQILRIYVTTKTISTHVVAERCKISAQNTQNRDISHRHHDALTYTMMAETVERWIDINRKNVSVEC